MRTSTILILALIIVAGGLLVWWASRDTGVTTADLPDTVSDEEVEVDGSDIDGDETDDTDTADTEQTSDEEGADEATGPTVVRYTEDGFTPESVTISTGEAIRFENETTDPMWVASNVHPVHAEYSGTQRSEHCAPGSTVEAFDQCESGATFTFTFDQTGSWTYHNHLAPGDGGTVVVQ